MNKTLLGIIIGAVLAAVVVAVFVSNNRNSSTAPATQDAQQNGAVEGDLRQKPPTTDSASGQFNPTGKKLAKNYYEYSESDYLAARESNRPIFLYFYANWCPTCARQEPIIVEIMNLADSKYDEIVAFRVNFNDNQTDNDEDKLARDFGVRYQHTMFVLDSGGNQQARFLGDTSSSTILAAFDKVI